MPESPTDTSTIHVQLGEIKGILSTIVTEHARRITDQESVTRQLRTDLTAVNSELTTKITGVDNKVITNTANIAELQKDVTETRTKQEAALPKAAQIMSPLIAAGSLIWAFIVGAK